MNDSDCVALLQWAAPRLGLRWQGFRRVRGQVCKRIARRAKELGLEAKAYRERIAGDPAEWARFDSFCRVTISRFYRDRAVFDSLRELLPDMLQRGHFRAWSAGAASGEEPWTLALLLRLELRHEDFEILASEVDAHLLERAQRACYPDASLRELPTEWKREAFTQQDDELCLQTRFRDGVRFVQQDLRRELPEGPFELVLCRNLVFSYFDEPTQRRFLDELHSRVTDRGLLVIGGHEQLPSLHPGWKPEGRVPEIYRRIDLPQL